MSKAEPVEARSLVWLRRIRTVLATEEARTPASVQRRRRALDRLVKKLRLQRLSPETIRARPRRTP
jgi:hypothetical protein